MLYKHYKRASVFCAEALVLYYILCVYFVIPSCTATATATVAPTIGLLPTDFKRFYLYRIDTIYNYL